MVLTYVIALTFVIAFVIFDWNVMGEETETEFNFDTGR